MVEDRDVIDLAIDRQPVGDLDSGGDGEKQCMADGVLPSASQAPSICVAALDAPHKKSFENPIITPLIATLL